jgi:hypothetical protein
MHFYWQAMGVFTGATRYSRQSDGPGEAKGTGGTPSVGAAMAAFNKAAVNKAAVFVHCAPRQATARFWAENSRPTTRPTAQPAAGTPIARMLPIGPGGLQSGFSTLSPQICTKGLSPKKIGSADSPPPPVAPRRAHFPK